jgi:hypothetical protein
LIKLHCFDQKGCIDGTRRKYMRVPAVKISCVAPGAVIKRGQKTALAVRPRVLRALASGVGSILSRMYELSKGVIPGDSDSGWYPNGYYPQVIRKKDPQAVLAVYLSKKGISLKRDEITFISNYIAPKCSQEIKGGVSEHDISIYPQMKMELLEDVSGAITAVLRHYLQS